VPVHRDLDAPTHQIAVGAPRADQRGEAPARRLRAAGVAAAKLIGRLITEGWNVDTARSHAGRLKDASEPPPWVDRETLAQVPLPAR
jgi:hypothetical protein